MNSVDLDGLSDGASTAASSFGRQKRRAQRQPGKVGLQGIGRGAGPARAAATLRASWRVAGLRVDVVAGGDGKAPVT